MATIFAFLPITPKEINMFKKTLLAITISAAAWSAQAAQQKDITLEQLGSYHTNIFDEGAAEIVAHDPSTQRLFVINAAASEVDVLDISNPTAPAKLFAINVASDVALSGGVNSIAVHDGLVAVAVENASKQANGWVAFYNTDGEFAGQVEAGALPDAVTFTPNGNYLLVANEGEPSGDYQNDPEGTVSVIDLRRGVSKATTATADFKAYNVAPGQTAPGGVRSPRPYGVTVAQDLEPEFITVSHDSKTAWVTLQENNAIAILDIRSATITGLRSLGNKDHSQPGNELDASDKDDAINIQNWPLLGTYMPDSIASFRVKGKTYLITANEGDAREYWFDIEGGQLLPGEDDEDACERLGGLDYDDDDGCLAFIDEQRIKDATLDETAFPDRDYLQANEQIGRLNMITTEGDIDGDGDYDQIHIFGGRSISIWDADAKLVADTGNTMEAVTAVETLFCAGEMTECSGFNSGNDENDSFDSRSDAKGPEPEGVVVGKIAGRQYAFVGLERVGGIMTFDVSTPDAPRYVSYFNNRNFDPSADVEDGSDHGDLGAEGLAFIKAEDSPTGQALLVVGNEISGSTTIYQVTAE